MRRRELLLAAGAAGLVAACAPRQPSSAPAEEPTLEDAFFYAFPLFEFARNEQARTGAGETSTGGFNTIAERARLSDHTNRQVTAPNNDTIYASAFLELSGGPLFIDSPSSHDRYFNVAFMDAFTDNFAYIGTRATGGEGGRYMVAGPGWDGDLPDGIPLFRASTNDVWMLMRTLVDGPDDLAAAQAFHRQLALSAPAGRDPVRHFHVAAADAADPANFLAVVNEMLARSPAGAGHTARAGRFAQFGIGAEHAPSSELLAQWREFLPRGIEQLKTEFLFTDLIEDGWSYQPAGVGDFGENDRLRAAIALGGLAALSEDEAMYFHANWEASGDRLTGERTYRWRVPAGGVPADAFWSLTMYEAMPDGRYFLVDNPIGRYSVGDRTEGLVTDADGGFEIAIQHAAPEGPMVANWLPAPAGPFRLALRAYLPRDELKSRSWRVPPLRRLA